MTVELIPSIYKEEVKCLVKKLDEIEHNNFLTKECKKVERTKILKQIQEYKLPVPIYLINPKVSQRLINTLRPIEWLDRKYDIGILNGYEYDKEKGLVYKSQSIENEVFII